MNSGKIFPRSMGGISQVYAWERAAVARAGTAMSVPARRVTKWLAGGLVRNAQISVSDIGRLGGREAP